MGKMNGSCLCGGVTYSSEAEPILTGLCHCRTCQKLTSSAFSVNVAMPANSVKIVGQTLRIVEGAGGSGQPVKLRMCSYCGSAIMTSSEAMPGMEFVKAGTLDDTSWLAPTMEIWCERAQPWVVIDKSRQVFGQNPG